jgi:hypothetical protein
MNTYTLVWKKIVIFQKNFGKWLEIIHLFPLFLSGPLIMNIQTTKCHVLLLMHPLKFICWNLITHVIIIRGGSFSRQLSHEGKILMGRIRAWRNGSHLCTIREHSFLPYGGGSHKVPSWKQRAVLNRHSILTLEISDFVLLCLYITQSQMVCFTSKQTNTSPYSLNL